MTRDQQPPELTPFDPVLDDLNVQQCHAAFAMNHIQRSLGPIRREECHLDDTPAREGDRQRLYASLRWHP